ncbi:hypothetical protein A2954_06445 [Candidatus Roizmanbacteria bacterium RIFCSPLOWO2_01_FULL_37_12]|uniref:PIN domain-containing protein n=1 Tax=Candidatus Roizmanbacteria bacterium RIFCSPLOWO2_01_FULL_37_12 TaxID=1802056 RepID=A0A1F7I9W6_9BACT|nr:MAG: hypothetical protein A2768_00640 [Candidatus Roizmanbacteria bacterium RIFCSPHIGHO2_01_FULL_37_16]OGK40148.1 MAG: hypothetical protein A2954_06445 [Candidatus Roizmanbacteria bacterium RIFCSPLOWO2_01_FULL_37_12]
MAKIFLDTNIFINYVEERGKNIKDVLGEHELTVSPLSLHILIYISKKKVPDSRLSEIIKLFFVVDFNTEITSKALNGPTKDFEDNVQLHSSAYAECDIFLTEDKELLKMKFFGTMKISSAV